MTNETTELRTRWASPPSRTIAAILREAGSDRSLEDTLNVDSKTAQALRDDSIDITPALATKLSESLGSSPNFWTNRYQQYRADVKRLEADQWARQAPSELFSSFGWVTSSRSWLDRIDTLLEFFEVPDLDSWRDRYEPLLDQVQYRRHDSGRLIDISIAAWLRQAQVIADQIELETFDRDRFAACVDTLGPISRIKDPGKFIPRLQELCAGAGVALIVLKAPRGCPISGATYVTEDGAPLIILSGRYLSDDHIWFTFLHEMAHVLLHGVERTFLDSLDFGSMDETVATEQQANAWASSQILTSEQLDECRSTRMTQRSVIRVAQRAGFAPGVVLGQLQHQGILRFNQFNKLKRRYRWSGLSLESAR